MKTLTKTFMATARTLHDATEEAKQQADHWLATLARIEKLRVEGQSFFTGSAHAHVITVTVSVPDSQYVQKS